MPGLVTMRGDRQRTKDAPVQSDEVIKFLAKAKSRVRMLFEAEAELRENMRDDMEFRASDQWDPVVKAERRADGRPTLTINRIPQFIRQVTNAQRASKPAIQVNPVDSGADPQVAAALQGVIRSVEVNSDADIAYSTAGEAQATMGRGYWRVITEWAADDGYEQDIKIKRCPNALAVGLDPAHTEVDGHDARWGIVFEDLPKDLFIERYGEEAAASYQAWMTGRDRSPDWMPEGRLRVMEYFYKEFTFETIVDIELPSLNGDGSTETIRCLKADIPDAVPDNWKVKNSRTIERAEVYWATITPTTILEGNDDLTGGKLFPSRYIPIVQVLGDELNIDGKRDLRGMVRDAKDPQKMYSFWASSLTEMIGQAPRAPYIGYTGQFKNHEAKWNAANRKSFAYLEVNPVTAGGNIAPLPQRQQFEPAIQSIVEAFKLADNDLKSVMGLFDASMGENGPEQSGKAILARQRQGELGNSLYADNLGRAIRYTGRIILDMIPRVLSPIRILRILGADNTSDNIMIHNGAPKVDVEAQAAAGGIQRIYDISVGRYDVSISTGSAYSSRRQEAIDAMLQLVNSFPQAAPIIGDLLVGNMDWPGAAAIAARLKKMVPKNMLDKDDPDFDPTPPEVSEHMKQLQEAYEELKHKLEAKMAEIQSKHELKQAELEMRERIAMQMEETKLVTAQMKMDFEHGQAALQAELDQINQRQDMLHEANQMVIDNQMAAADLAKQHELQQQQQEHEQGQAEQEHSRNLELDAQQQKSDERIAKITKPSGA